MEEWCVDGTEVESFLDMVKKHFERTKPLHDDGGGVEDRMEQLLLLLNCPDRKVVMGGGSGGGGSAAQEEEEEEEEEEERQKKLYMYRRLARSRMVEHVILVGQRPENGWIGVTMYVDDAGGISGAIENVRATELARCCGVDVRVMGDAFVSRVKDDGGEGYERLEMTLKDDMSSRAAWVMEAKRENMKRRMEMHGGRGKAAPLAAPTADTTIVETEGDAMRMQGNEAYAQGDYQRAVDLYTARLEQDCGEDVNARNNRAMALLKMHRYDEACVDAALVLEKDPDNDKAMMRLAAGEVGAGRVEKGMEVLRELVRRRPRHSEARRRLATLERAGRW